MRLNNADFVAVSADARQYEPSESGIAAWERARARYSSLTSLPPALASAQQVQPGLPLSFELVFDVQPPTRVLILVTHGVGFLLPLP